MIFSRILLYHYAWNYSIVFIVLSTHLRLHFTKIPSSHKKLVSVQVIDGHSCVFYTFQSWTGQQPIKVMDTATMDLEAVFLSGMLGLQANKCFECGCVLDPSAGREFLSDHSVNKRTSTGQAEIMDTNSNRTLGFLPVKFNRSNSTKESGPRRPSPTRLLQDQTTRMRICHMTGKYYCDRCHWNDQWYVPGSIFLLNDTSMHPVSDERKIILAVI